VAVIAARAERIKAKQTRRNGKRPSVRGSAELVPPAEPQRDAAEATTEHSDAAARPDATAQHDANAPAATPSDADASGDRQSQRDAVVPPMAAETSTAESTTPGARSTQAYAPNMQTRSRQLPVRGAGTVKLWAGDLPAPQSSKKTTARARRPRKQATKPSIVTLPPPVIIGVEKA
jgi:hypothetical protein